MARRSGKPGMSDGELARFIMHYERLTRHILATMPTSTNLSVRLDTERIVLDVSERPLAQKRLGDQCLGAVSHSHASAINSHHDQET